ncbi:MAG: DUF4097 family beta strand repeat protein, partial [Acidobacteriota bacterium]|nr:DUF4097 family beta strand repeat protein [Acidobacteriota bacterium]
MGSDTINTSSTAAEPRERRETFEVGGPVSAFVTTRSADVVILQGDGATLAVRLRAPGGAEALLKECEVRYDDASRTLHVVSAAASKGGRGLRRSLFGSSRDVDVEITLPAGSNVEATTASGDCDLRADLSAAHVTTASGDAVITEARDAEVRSASGDVRVSRCHATLSVRTASGDVSVGEAATTSKVESASGDVSLASTGEATEVSTASGDVHVAATRAGRLGVRSASGDVRISVASGLEIDVVAHSVSGDLSSSIPLDAATSAE